MPEPKRYQCRHIFTDGHRCGSPCLRHEEFCYYHHTTRRPIEAPHARRARQTHFDLPLPEDRSAIQQAIGQVLLAIAANTLDPRRAGLLLYGLQIASSNLPRHSPDHTHPPQVEEITTHPEQGLLAPATEYDEDKISGRPTFLRDILNNLRAPKDTQEPQPITIPSIQATTQNPSVSSVQIGVKPFPLPSVFIRVNPRSDPSKRSGTGRLLPVPLRFRTVCD